MFGLRDSDLSILHEIFSRYQDIEEAVLFGSRAKGSERPGSDVDIALKGTGGNAVACAVATFLNQESSLPYFFDIIDYHSIDNDALIDHIHRMGKRIYQKHSNLSAESN